MKQNSILKKQIIKLSFLPAALKNILNEKHSPHKNSNMTAISDTWKWREQTAQTSTKAQLLRTGRCRTRDCALSNSVRAVPLDKESETTPSVREGWLLRPVREPSGSLAETGPFSFLVIIEIGSQVLLLSRGAPLALITRCHAGLRTRPTTRSAALSSRGLKKSTLWWNGYLKLNTSAQCFWLTVNFCWVIIFIFYSNLIVLIKSETDTLCN